MRTSADLDAEHDAPDAPEVERESHDVEQTRRLGEILGGLAQPGDIVLLYGDLGAGKTALTQGIGRGLGVTTVINSPTFTILKEYEGRIPLYHFDLYRVVDPDELLALGFEEYFEDGGVCVVEWAERGEPEMGEAAWPASWLRIRFTAPAPDQRRLRCTAAGARGRALLDAFAQATASTASSETPAPPGASASGVTNGVS